LKSHLKNTINTHPTIPPYPFQLFHFWIKNGGFPLAYILDIDIFKQFYADYMLTGTYLIYIILFCGLRNICYIMEYIWDWWLWKTYEIGELYWCAMYQWI